MRVTTSSAEDRTADCERDHATQNAHGANGSVRGMYHHHVHCHADEPGKNEAIMDSVSTTPGQTVAASTTAKMIGIRGNTEALNITRV